MWIKWETIFRHKPSSYSSIPLGNQNKKICTCWELIRKRRKMKQQIMKWKRVGDGTLPKETNKGTPFSLRSARTSIPFRLDYQARRIFLRFTRLLPLRFLIPSSFCYCVMWFKMVAHFNMTRKKNWKNNKLGAVLTYMLELFLEIFIERLLGVRATRRMRKAVCDVAGRGWQPPIETQPNPLTRCHSRSVGSVTPSLTFYARSAMKTVRLSKIKHAQNKTSSVCEMTPSLAELSFSGPTTKCSYFMLTCCIQSYSAKQLVLKCCFKVSFYCTIEATVQLWRKFGHT